MQTPPSAKIPPEALPRSDAGRLDWLRLARSRRVGPATFIRLIRELGSAGAALDALPGIAAEAGAGSYAPCSRAEATAELERGLAAGARPLLLGAGLGRDAGQGVERRPGGAELADQPDEGRGPDPPRARQPQPVEPARVGAGQRLGRDLGGGRGLHAAQ